MLNVRLVFFVFCFVFSGLLAGCSSIKMNVDSFNNPYLQVADYHKFSFIPSKNVDKEKEQHLFSVVKKELEDKGFILDDKAPQFFVAVRFSESNFLQNDKNDKVGTDVAKKVTIIFIDNLYRKHNVETKMVWQGEASTHDTRNNFSSADVEKCLVIGILKAYPDKLKSVDTSINSYWCRD